jgi:hypothetical protein
VARFQSGAFEGISGWEYPGREEGNASPLCWPGITLGIESATGKQAGKQVDLVLSKQLVFKEFQKVNVRVGKQLPSKSLHATPRGGAPEL